MNWRDISNPSAGGAELFTHEILKKWVRWGNSVRLITCAYPDAKRAENVDGIDVSRVGSKYTVYILSALRFIGDYQDDYDVVVDQVNSFPFLTPLYCRLPIVPLIFQVTGEIFYHHMPEPFASIAIGVEPLLLRAYRKCPTIVLSNSVKHELVSRGFSASRIYVCPPGTDHEEFRSGKKTHTPSLLYLNRFAKYKNPDHVLISFKEVVKAVPSCTLVMAGARTNKELQHFRELAEQLGVSNSTKILGFVKGETKVQLLQQSWIHVLPSLKEGWGISILEAAACGTPTVSYDVSGVKDAVQNFKTGILVPYGQIDYLARALTTLLTDQGLRESMSKECVKWSNEFSWNNSARRAMIALEQAIGTKSATTRLRANQDLTCTSN